MPCARVTIRSAKSHGVVIAGTPGPAFSDDSADLQHVHHFGAALIDQLRQPDVTPLIRAAETVAKVIDAGELESYGIRGEICDLWANATEVGHEFDRTVTETLPTAGVGYDGVVPSS